MRSLQLLLVFSNYVLAQTYGYPDINNGPDHGTAKNYSWLEPDGIPTVPYVRSEITMNGQTFSYIRTGEENFKLCRKAGNQFKNLINNLLVRNDDRTMGEDSRLLYVYEDQKSLNIYSWGRSGYTFTFYQKKAAQEPGLIRFGCVKNANHTYFAFDKSIQSIEFSGADQMKIATIPAEGGKKGPYDFKRPGVYEFRPDGVYLDGVFDPSVQDYEPQDVVDENLRKDPQFYAKRQALHAERVASYTKEVMDAEAARVAALPPPQTLQPSVAPAVPESQPKPIAAIPSVPKPVAAAIPEAVVDRNLTAWLAGLVAILLGCFGWQYFRRKAGR